MYLDCNILTVFSDHKFFSLNRTLRKKAFALKSLDDEITALNVYYWIRAEIRYSNGFFIRDLYGRPHCVYKRKRAVCLDQSILYVSMVRKLGLESCVAYCSVKKSDDHAVALVRINGEVVAFDVSSGTPNIRNLNDYIPVNDIDVVENIKVANRSIKLFNIIKRAVVAFVLSGSLTFSQDYWYTENVDTVKKETIALVQNVSRDVKSLYDHFGQYINRIKKIF